VSNSVQSWQALQDHFDHIKDLPLLQLFNHDPRRAQTLSWRDEDWLIDYSKNLITAETLTHFCALAKSMQLELAIDDLFCGENVNFTEKRAALHTALRDPTTMPLMLNGVNIRTQIHTQKDKLNQLVTALQQGQWRGVHGDTITDVVAIGIGGSHLGPAMICAALSPVCQTHLRVHFVANMDKVDLDQSLQQIDPARTVFIIASKTFTTQDTLLNANSARAWLEQQLNQKISALKMHFIAITADKEKAVAWGIAPEHCLLFWDWVGGRYSVWSSLGLPIALQFGTAVFDELLRGAYSIDQIQKGPMENNIAFILASLSIWYRSFYQRQAHAIIPYAQALHFFPRYLQQLIMESNGKSVDKNGLALQHPSSPIIWGGVGANGQHAFHQQFHQGNIWCPIDFILPLQHPHYERVHQDFLIAHCLAQTQALMCGQPHADPHQHILGNRPSTLIAFPKISAYHLGRLIALYEHQTYIDSVLLGNNAFDQYGVELGKKLAQPIWAALQGDRGSAAFDPSTAQTLDYIKNFRDR